MYIYVYIQLKREEREFAKWLQQRDRDQKRITELQAPHTTICVSSYY